MIRYKRKICDPKKANKYMISVPMIEVRNMVVISKGREKQCL